MSPAERGVISMALAQLSTLKVQDTVSRAKTDMDMDWLLAGINHLLKKLGLPIAGKPERINSHWREDIEKLRKYLAPVIKDLSPPEKAAFGRVCAAALAELIREQRVAPLGMRTLLRNIGQRLPEALEASFPGYVRSGMVRGLLVVDNHLLGRATRRTRVYAENEDLE